MADRIQARAIRRCGELLKQIEPANGANQNIREGNHPKVTREMAAADAGLRQLSSTTPAGAGLAVSDLGRLLSGAAFHIN